MGVFAGIGLGRVKELVVHRAASIGEDRGSRGHWS